MSGTKISKLGHAEPDRLIAFLRGVHPAKTAESVAFDTGVSISTVRKWLDGSSAPGFIASWALIAAYGLPIIAAAFDVAPRWLDDAYRQQKMDELDARRRALEDEMKSLLRG